jgi:hypothetical protein
MTIKRLLFPVLAFFLTLICSGCGLSKEEIVGNYSVHDEGASSESAIDLRSDGTFIMYRTKNLGEGDGINAYHASDTEQYPSISGNGTWELENRFPLGQQISLKSDGIQSDGRGFIDMLIPTRKDGLACFEVRHHHNKEYWCKSD